MVDEGGVLREYRSETTRQNRGGGGAGMANYGATRTAAHLKRDKNWITCSHKIRSNKKDSARPVVMKRDLKKLRFQSPRPVVRLNLIPLSPSLPANPNEKWQTDVPRKYISTEVKDEQDAMRKLRLVAEGRRQLSEASPLKHQYFITNVFTLPF